VGALLARVELEVRRADHGNGIGPGLARVRRERDGLRRGLRAAVRGDEHPPADRFEP
jgi:hypothetical protein